MHDIEDLVKAGGERKACPYFAARKFAENAELIFSPYNYLLDPVIRKAMKVDTENAVLIFDEAHNIEDICRCCPTQSLYRRISEGELRACVSCEEGIGYAKFQ